MARETLVASYDISILRTVLARRPARALAGLLANDSF